MKIRTLVSTMLTIICLFGTTWAAPQKVNFQGKLSDAAGNPVNASVSMTFNIYDVAGGGTALWTETQTVMVTNGVYNVLLGKNNPIDTELTETKALWLGVNVGADAEMSPRAELTPGVYDLIMLNAISVKNGYVGIGTSNPSLQSGYSNRFLQISGSRAPGVLFEDTSTDEQIFLYNYEGKFSVYDATEEVSLLVIDASGNVGIGTGSPGYKLHVAGTMKVNGADLAEPFDMTDIDALEFGDVVVIDADNPVHVKKSLTAYDTMVAGIVSGKEQAGYVAGSRSDGSSDKPIALVGRVLCNVSAENGAIQIGDLLTTSNTPGYAMKATDNMRWDGAILGKALQAFDGEKGQIMVLVTLQ